jgi:replicative DNA helicase
MNAKLYAIEAEQALLGGCIIGGMVPDVEPSAWYWERHALIAQALAACRDAGVPIDLVTVSERLSSMDVLNSIGGPAYLASLVESVPSGENASVYAGIVRQKAVARHVLSSLKEASQSIETGEDVDGVISRVIGDLCEATKTKYGREVTVGDAAMEALKTIQLRMGTTEPLAISVPSGLSALDDITSGFQRDEFAIVAARPSMGKTAALLHAAVSAAQEGAKAHLFSLEMPAYAVVCRILSQLSGVECSRLRRGAITEPEYEAVIRAAKECAGLNIIIDDSTGYTIVDVINAVRRTRPDIVLVDYLGLLRPYQREQTREREVAVASRAFHGMAKEYHAAVVVAHQLNRGAEKERREPMLSDLRESGAIEQDADVVVFIHAEDRADKYRELIVAKNRNGRVGRATVNWQGACTRMWCDPVRHVKVA